MEQFKETLDRAFPSFMNILQWVRDQYVMDELIKGNEVKFRRSGKTLVTFYVHERYFETLIIFGKKEREVFDQITQDFTPYIQDYYQNSKTYHDGKWMFIKIDDDQYLDDIKHLITIKKKSNKKVSI